MKSAIKILEAVTLTVDMPEFADQKGRPYASLGLRPEQIMALKARA